VSELACDSLAVARCSTASGAVQSGRATTSKMHTSGAGSTLTSGCMVLEAGAFGFPSEKGAGLAPLATGRSEVGYDSDT
jgi:hypothetical protein